MLIRSGVSEDPVRSDNPQDIRVKEILVHSVCRYSIVEL